MYPSVYFINDYCFFFFILEYSEKSGGDLREALEVADTYVEQHRKAVRRVHAVLPGLGRSKAFAEQYAVFTVKND